jgi:4-hydroxy-tetrahydrodipicolinate synthase
MKIKGVYAASITPLKKDFSPDLDSLPGYLDFLARRGCHGALLFGTTGEGPSFSPEQRIKIFKAALEVRQEWPEFRLLAGTGTPSLDETEGLTKSVFDLGFDGAVLLPPYYFRASGEDGLFSWYKRVLERSVPIGGTVLAYHIPAVSGVPLSLNLLSGLREAYPNKFLGLKDSSGDPELAVKLGNRFGNDFHVFTGNDRLFSLALENGASGCITATANLISPDLRILWDDFQAQKPSIEIQEQINSVRETLEIFPPFPPLIKYLLARFYNFPLWPVCPPLSPISKETQDRVSTKLDLD